MSRADMGSIKRKPWAFQVGDVVCASKQKLAFEKGCETLWQEKLAVGARRTYICTTAQPAVIEPILSTSETLFKNGCHKNI